VTTTLTLTYSLSLVYACYFGMTTPTAMGGASATQAMENGSHVGQQSSGAGNSRHDLTDDGSHRGDIAQGKQNARAVVAASGVQLNSTATDSSPVLPSSSIVNGSKNRSESPISSPTAVARRRETPADKILLEQYVNREFKHNALEAWKRYHPELLDEKRRERDHYAGLQQVRRDNPSAIFGPGYIGYGNGTTDLKVHPQQQIVYPRKRKRPGKRQTMELRIPRKDMLTQAEQLEDLVPIRLDVEWEKIKLRDTFTWNFFERTISPELFSEYLVEDFQLPPSTHGPLITQIVQSMRMQIDDFHPHKSLPPQPSDEGSSDASLPHVAYHDDEMRVLIKLNITIGQATLMDQFEWDLNNPANSPEEFALLTAKENNLSGEFTTAIAHSIREQTHLFTKSLYIVGYEFDGRPVEDADLRAAFLPSPMPSTFRPQQAQKDFTPYIYDLNEGELEKTELSISREQRRQKRSVNRRGGPALPDLKDRQRTIRTSIVSTRFPGAATSMEESRIYKPSSTGRIRRAAGGQRDGLDSDESESEESLPGSPAIPSHLLQGTARTRGLRGAASAAQAAMRAATLGRSATPETSLHHHETRTSARRFGGRDYREDSADEPDKLILKLKISKEKLRQFMRGGLAQRQQNSPFPKSQSGTPQISTPIQKAMAPPQNPPATARSPSQPSGGTNDQRGGVNSSSQPALQQIGVVDAPHPPGSHPAVRMPIGPSA
jgi:SWI/SNF-related matrix-associated actin-dependent regulator of chromatin subfamily B protein 1